MNPSNPLFPSNNDNEAPQSQPPLLPAHTERFPARAAKAVGANAAADLIRQKVARLYAEEPNAATEVQAAQQQPMIRSKHQQFMYDLSNSGKSLAEIQTEWHRYYATLADNEKHEVWQEFYENNSRTGRYNSFLQEQTTQVSGEAATIAPPNAAEDGGIVVADHTPVVTDQTTEATPSLQELTSKLRGKVANRSRVKRGHRLHSLFVGLATGCIVLLIFLFGFFNEVIIAPFIQPGRNVSATPIIVDPTSGAPSSTPEVIIPKINVEIPLDFTQTSTDEATIENALENGVVHYPSTVMPGEKGNAAFFGHSSNNIFNKGKYKFAFVLLHELQNGDNFYLTKDGKVYTYTVISKTIVPPTDVSVLNNVAGETATATLITCDPPGTSINRLVVVGRQISPDPSGNTQASQPAVNDANSKQLPGNGPTLWSRFWHWLF